MANTTVITESRSTDCYFGAPGPSRLLTFTQNLDGSGRPLRITDLALLSQNSGDAGGGVVRADRVLADVSIYYRISGAAE